jgi:hypothetical protein
VLQDQLLRRHSFFRQVQQTCSDSRIPLPADTNRHHSKKQSEKILVTNIFWVSNLSMIDDSLLRKKIRFANVAIFVYSAHQSLSDTIMKNHKESINYNAFLKYGLSFS